MTEQIKPFIIGRTQFYIKTLFTAGSTLSEIHLIRAANGLGPSYYQGDAFYQNASSTYIQDQINKMLGEVEDDSYMYSELANVAIDAYEHISLVHKKNSTDIQVA